MTRFIAIRHVPFLASLAVLIGAYIFGAVSYDYFASIDVIRNLVVDNAFLAVAALGATFVILMGGIDLSVGSVMAFTSILIATLIKEHSWHPATAFAVAALIGTAFGTLQGFLIQTFRLPAFLVTLAGLFIARGAAFAVHIQSLSIQHPFVSNTLNESLSLTLPIGERGMTIPFNVFIVLAVLLASWFVLAQTRFGRAVYAVGDDESSALLVGLPVARVRISVYAISGLLSALAGIVFVLYQQSGDPSACKGFELDAIAAVVIGGTLLRGGVGSIPGTVVGVAILGLIQTLIAFHGNLSSWWTRIAIGMLVLIFVSLQRVIGILASRGAR